MRHTAVLVAWATAATVLVVDQLTKAWAVAALEGGPERPVLGELLKFSFVRNSGAAFGLGAGATIVFSLLAIVVAVVLFRMSTRLVSMWWAVALGLMLGGAVGNLIDRLFRSPAPLQGHVVDFLRLPHWPVFNVADMSLVTAAVMIVGLSLLNVPYDRPRESAKDPAAA
ncbi:MAG TPA: signal peptidase II [Actinomycetota bacterium]|nr:signal peptidase II [Actinomycetota bacterium]